jgi:CYTH domain-containing protein
MMVTEIEKKFLLREDGKEFATTAFYKHFGSVERLRQMIHLRGVTIYQGYLPENNSVLSDMDIQISFVATEVRLRRKGGMCFLTAKSSGGLQRDEFETEISRSEFNELWPLTEGRRIEKVRWAYMWGSLTYEFDHYADWRDLLVCEVELPSVESIKDAEQLGQDITEDEKYKNKNLAK